jgi:glycosyltransferase involved in cell wall biosynthesis
MKNGLFTTEAFDIIIPIRSYDEYHGITLCSVILNEEKYIKDFLEYYKPYVKSIVIIDGGSSDRTVEVATPIADRIRIRKFDGHYSNQANRAVEMAETDWILLMDCDERLEKPALENLNNMINQEEADCWAFPRKNFIDGM